MCSLLCLPPPGVLGGCPLSSGGKVDGRGGLNSVRWLSPAAQVSTRGAMLSGVTPPVGPSWNICFCLGHWVCVDPLSVSTRDWVCGTKPSSMPAGHRVDRPGRGSLSPGPPGQLLPHLPAGARP